MKFQEIHLWPQTPIIADGGRGTVDDNELQRGFTHLITSLSEGNSVVMSSVSFSICLGDMRGKGADVSSPKIDRMSCRMCVDSSCCSVAGSCSLRMAGMLFCPRYLDPSEVSPPSSSVTAE